MRSQGLRPGAPVPIRPPCYATVFLRRCGSGRKLQDLAGAGFELHTQSLQEASLFSPDHRGSFPVYLEQNELRINSDFPLQAGWIMQPSVGKSPVVHQPIFQSVSIYLSS